MNRHLVIISMILCLLIVALGLAFAPSRKNTLPATIVEYSTTTSFATLTSIEISTLTESVSLATQSIATFEYTAPYALIGPQVGPLSGFLPPNQTGCVYLYASDHNTYSIYNLPVVYPTGQVIVYGQYLTWEPSPQDSCVGIRIYVTSINQQ